MSDTPADRETQEALTEIVKQELMKLPNDESRAAVITNLVVLLNALIRKHPEIAKDVGALLSPGALDWLDSAGEALETYFERLAARRTN